jgi:hypothetical protein
MADTNPDSNPEEDEDEDESFSDNSDYDETTKEGLARSRRATTTYSTGT